MPGEKKVQGHLLNMNKYLTGEWFKKRWNQTLLSGIQQMDKGPLEQIIITEIPHKHKKILWQWRWSGTDTHYPERSFCLWKHSKPDWVWPWATDPALGMELDKTISSSTFQNQQFWDSQVEETSLCPMQILKTATASILLYFIPGNKTRQNETKKPTLIHPRKWSGEAHASDQHPEHTDYLPYRYVLKLNYSWFQLPIEYKRKGRMQQWAWISLLLWL